MIRISSLMLVFLANLCCAEGEYETLAKELQVYLPEGVTAVVAYKGEKHEHVRIRWEKPFVVYQEVINGPPDGESHHKSLDHDPIGIRITPFTNLKEVYAHKAEYFTMKSSLVEWTEKMKNMPGIHGKEWAFGGPEDWLRGSKPTTDDERRLVAEFEVFLKAEYVPVMAKRRTCPNFIFKGRFILMESSLTWIGTSFEPSGSEAIKSMLRTIESRCEGHVEKY